MKLIDILVEELPKSGGWLRDVKTMAQDRGGNIWGYDCVSPCLIGGLWSSKSGDNLVSNSKIEARNLSVDWATSIITREQYEAALAAKNDGWIEWGGGECPLHHGAIVDVKLRNGRTEYAQKALSTEAYASYPSWRNDGTGGDIIAYRLHQLQEAEQPEAREEDLNECIGQAPAPVWNGDGKPTMGTKCQHHSGGQWEVVTIAGIYENLMTGFTDYWMVREDGSSYTVGNPYRFRPIRSEADKRRDEAKHTIAELCRSASSNGHAADLIYDAIAAGEVLGVKLED